MDTTMIIYCINVLLKNIKHLQLAKEESEKKVFSNILKEGGNKLWNYFIYMAIPNYEEIPYQYKDVNALRNSNPKLYSQWKDAMNDEIKSLNEREIWELVDCLKGRTPIKGR